MNWKSPLLPVLAFASLLLPSCESSGGAGGAVITNPTAEDVTRMENQWGMKPRVIKPRLRPMEPGDIPMNTTPTPTPAEKPEPEPAPIAPAPAPKLQEPVASEAPQVDAATIQKLR